MVTMLVLPTSLPVALFLVALLVLDMGVSTGTPTASPVEDSAVPAVPAEVAAADTLVVEATLAVVVVDQPVVMETANGKTASTSQDLLTHVLSVSSSVYPMILPSNRLVSISRSTTTFQSRLLVKACQSQLPHSQTLLSTTISLAILSTLVTMFQHQYRNTPFLS